MRRPALIVIAGSVPATCAPVAQPPPAIKPSSAWIEVCETPSAAGKDKTCLVLHEQIDARSGRSLVEAAVQQAGERYTFVVEVPAGVQQAAGARVVIYPHDLRQRAARNDRLGEEDSRRLRILELRYRSCDAEGCKAETAASAELVAHLGRLAARARILYSTRAIVAAASAGMAAAGPRRV